MNEGKEREKREERRGEEVERRRIHSDADGLPEGPLSDKYGCPSTIGVDINTTSKRDNEEENLES